MRKTRLALSADLLHDLARLPTDLGLYDKDSSLGLSVKPDGMGGVVVEAISDSVDRKISLRTEMTEEVSDDDSTIAQKKVKSNRWPWILVGVCIILVILITLYVVFKRHSKLIKT